MKRTRGEISDIVEGLGYFLLDEYIGKSYAKRIVVEDGDGYKYDVKLSHLIDKHVPNFVGKNNPFTLNNISLWLKKENKSFILCEGNVFNGTSKKLFFKCLKEQCQEMFDAKWNNIYTGTTCPFCAGQKVGKYNNLSYLRPDLEKEWDYSKNKKNPKEYTIGNGEKVFWICSKCNYNWNTKILHRTHGSGCPKCNQSKGEKKIYDYLIKNNLKFKIEFPLKNCRYKKQLYLDFYLLDYKSGIEYHGIQHYEPVDFFGGKKEFNEQQKRDKSKEKACEDNHTLLLIIPYWEFDNIENIMKDYIFKISS